MCVLHMCMCIWYVCVFVYLIHITKAVNYSHLLPMNVTNSSFLIFITITFTQLVIYIEEPNLGWAIYTINRERFAGLNFYVFRGFQEHRKSFPVNIYKLCIMTRYYCKHKTPQKFSCEKLYWMESAKV